MAKPTLMSATIKYTAIRPTVMKGCPDAHNVFLIVDNQQFCITPDGCETKEEAEWMLKMLCLALDKIVAKAAIIPTP
jgi:hypothetical protein